MRLRRALSQHIVADFRASRHLKWGHRAQVLHASKINRAKDLPVAQLSRVRNSSKRFRTKTAEKDICHSSPATYPAHAPQITRDVEHKSHRFGQCRQASELERFEPEFPVRLKLIPAVSLLGGKNSLFG